MARYGYAIYGEDTYGTTDGTPNLLWGLNVDWNGDGYFDGRNDAVNMRSMYWRRGRMNYVSADGVGFEKPERGYCVIQLDNSSGIYDPNNTSGALYPYIEPGKYAKVRVIPGVGCDPEPVFAGKIESIVPIGGVDDPRVQITIYDGNKLLSEASVTTTLYETIGTGEAISHCLTEAQWPTIWGTNLDVGNDTIPFWWVNGQKANSAIDDIIQSECGRTAVLGDGSFRFRARSSPSASVVTIDQTQMRKDIQLMQPWEVVRNLIRVNVYSKVEQTTAALWIYSEKPFVDAGESLTVWGNFSYSGRSVAASTIIDPVATTDYTMNAQLDGGGADLTGSFTVGITKFAETCKLVITNTGVTGGYIQTLQVRGLAIDTQNSTYVENDASLSGTKRVFEVDSPNMQDTILASSRAAYLQRILNQTRKFPIFQMESQPCDQFSFDLLDRITVQIPYYNINTDYIVGGIEGEWLSDTGQAVLTTVHVETFPAQTGYWIFTTTFPTIFP